MTKNRVIARYGEPVNFEEMLSKCKQYMEEVAFKNKIKILMLGVQVGYSNQTSNTHSCPIGGKCNWRWKKTLPQGYPGWSGRLWVAYSKDPTSVNVHMFDSLSQVYLHTGTGGYGWYQNPWIGNMHMLSKQECYPLSWDVRIWASDWPLVRKNIVLDEKKNLVEHAIDRNTRRILNKPIQVAVKDKDVL